MDKNLYDNRINYLNGVLLLITLFACGLCMVHYYYVRPAMGFNLSFLIWNLFLCVIPYILSFVLYRRCLLTKKKSWLNLMLGVIWLLFFPNAIYILTDNLHFRLLKDIFHVGNAVGTTSADPKLWFSFAVLTLFIILGFIMSMVSLYFVQVIILNRYGKINGWIFSLGIMFISTYGIYLGRIYRFNSWDVVSRPLYLLYKIIQSLNLETFIFMVILTLMYYPLYIVFYALMEAYKSRY